MKAKTVSPPIIPDKLYFKIGEVANLTGLKPYVLRYWESEFNIKPAKSKKNQRLYQRKDIEQFLKIKELLYEERFTIAGAKKLLRRGRGRNAKSQSPQLDFTEMPKPTAVQSLPKGVLQQIRKEIVDLKNQLK